MRDAVLVPVVAADRPGLPFTFGVFDAAGSPVPEGAFPHRGKDLAVAPLETPQRRIAGRHVFAGVLLQHFGHAILEGLSRAWYLRSDPPIPPLWLTRSERPSRVMLDLLSITGIAAAPEAVLREAVEVEELLVPEQGCAYGGFYHPCQAAALSVLPFGEPVEGRRVWLSRGALPPGLARIEGEAEIEARLLSAGWTIVSPERLMLRDQLLTLAGAQEIAGFMGSAFHLLLLLDTVRARVRILDRGLPKDLVATYEAIAHAKGFRQEILPVATRQGRRVGPRQSITLEAPALVAERLLDGAA